MPFFSFFTDFSSKLPAIQQTQTGTCMSPRYIPSLIKVGFSAYLCNYEWTWGGMLAIFYPAKRIVKLTEDWDAPCTHILRVVAVVGAKWIGRAVKESRLSPSACSIVKPNGSSALTKVSPGRCAGPCCNEIKIHL